MKKIGLVVSEIDLRRGLGLGGMGWGEGLGLGRGQGGSTRLHPCMWGREEAVGSSYYIYSNATVKSQKVKFGFALPVSGTV